MKQKNQLVNLAVSMTSLEIAELTSKEHKNVLVDIRTMLGELEIDGLGLQLIYKDSMNRKQVMFILSRRETLILISGYSIELRTKIIDRLDYLEKENLQLRNDLQLKEKARQEARMEYKPMTDAILAIRGADAKPYHYSNEANLVYLVVMGATCKKLKEHLELETLDNLRDALTPLQIAAVQDIQKHNTTLLEIEMNYDERKIQLNKIFNRKWADKLLEEHIKLEA